VDLNAHREPAWLNEVARRVRRRLNRSHLPLVVGDGDWESQNLRWIERSLHVVHDSDSVVAAPESAIAGAAAAGFPGEARPAAASLGETRAFLTAYEIQRGRDWSPDGREIAWAAGAWLMAYNGKIEVVQGGPSPVLDRLRADAQERLRLAGA
jgi:hypothetical protein